MDEFKEIRLVGVGFSIRSKEDYKLIPIIAWLHKEFPLMGVEVIQELREEFFDLLRIQVRCDMVRILPPRIKNKTIIGSRNKNLLKRIGC